MKKEDCIFCKIANGEIPSKTLYEDGDFRVIMDLGPATRGHALILLVSTWIIFSMNCFEDSKHKVFCSCKKDGNKDDREITLRWSHYLYSE